MRPLIFGEVLFDCFADGSEVLGGAPFNVAWHLHAFGFKPLLISRLGDDSHGDQILAAMRTWGMDVSGMQQDCAHATGRVEITTSDGEPSYTIIDDVAYDHIDGDALQLPQGEWLLYHGSLALRNSVSLQALKRLKLLASPQVVVDINLRSPWWQRRQVIDLFADATLLKLNEHELAEIFCDEAGEDQQLEALYTYCTAQVLLTRGEKGAQLYNSRGESLASTTPKPVAQVVDTVGAGDAFCSVLLIGHLLNWSHHETLERAQQFASAIVGVRGATVRDHHLYSHFCKAWKIKGAYDV